MSPSLHSFRRRGTIMLFFLAAMAVVGTFVAAMLRSQSDQATGVSAEELRLIAEATALSGIEIMATIADNAVEHGPEFLRSRERDLPSGTPYSFANLFGLPIGVTSTYYLPPNGYPPLKDICLTITPTNKPTSVTDTDIRMMNNRDSVNLPARDFYFVLGGTDPTVVPGFNGPAILPAAGYQPLGSDTTHYTTGCNKNAGGGWRIEALEPKDPNVALAWFGDENAASYLPDMDLRHTGYSGCQKMPPPSFVIGNDFSLQGTTWRCFLYAWYVRSQTGLASPDRQWYYMTSGRVREVRLRNDTNYKTLGPEVAVSATQLR